MWTMPKPNMVIPQAICIRYGFAVGSNFVWLVRILMIICYPMAYSIGKILNSVLEHNEALFRRAKFKALVSIQSKEIASERLKQRVFDITC
ncbi:putative DUF21 domain-containing protein At1g03270 [Rosa chinensis]|uniref:putative DUF21 domain-containing protein At1g03270 n=1 Tax=Rosa chinensis TaxID=74649 RepID=UPI001AD8CDE6|nr:putative DUF21 domain-containing protein At1g03270 [Rosa chinensis]XP_040371304.1 putative DUF21 domain-containing protein At1g03270 [Rosa chinensis]